jgi:hypothetical protein
MKENAKKRNGEITRISRRWGDMKIRNPDCEILNIY